MNNKTTKKMPQKTQKLNGVNDVIKSSPKHRKVDDNFLERKEQLIDLFERYGNLLPQSQKQVFHLYYLEDLALSEIAKIVVTSRQAVNDALKKAHQKLLDIAKKCENN